MLPVSKMKSEIPQKHHAVSGQGRFKQRNTNNCASTQKENSPSDSRVFARCD